MSAPVPPDTRAADARTRFLRAIADRVPLDRVAEVHVFPAIRQGTTESGVAVVAVLREEDALGADEAATVAANESAAGGLADAARGGEDAAAVSAPAEQESGQATLFADDESGAGPNASDGAASRAPSEGEPPPSEIVSSDGADRGAPPQLHDTSTDAPVPHPERAARTVPTRVARRLTIFSARYRLVLKGPDRGKWDVDVRAEADAPLLTVDAVVRGVLRRSPDSAEPERLLGDQFRALVEPSPPVGPTIPAR